MDKETYGGAIHSARSGQRMTRAESLQQVPSNAQHTMDDACPASHSGIPSPPRGPNTSVQDHSMHADAQSSQYSRQRSRGSDTYHAEQIDQQLKAVSLTDGQPVTPAPADLAAPENAPVSSVTRAGPGLDETDPELAKAGFVSSRYIPAKEGKEELLHPDFKRRRKPKEFFKFGRVFLVLWAEPAGETVVTRPENAISISRFGERVHAKVRRFVVLQSADGSCSVLPITTNRGNGVAKHGVTKAHYSVIYTGREPPPICAEEHPQIRGELPMQKAIKVVPDVKTDRLDSMSRLNYYKIYTVEHYNKVKAFGMIDEQHQDLFRAQLNAVWNAWLPRPRELISTVSPSQITTVGKDSTHVDHQTLVQAITRYGYSVDEVNDFLKARQGVKRNEESSDSPADGHSARNPHQRDDFTLTAGQAQAERNRTGEPRVITDEVQPRTHQARIDVEQMLREQGMSRRDAHRHARALSRQQQREAAD